AFVEQRIPLARNLDEWPIVLRRMLLIQHSYRLPARGCIDTCDLLVATEFRNWHLERHQVKIEPTLRILARIAQFEQIEYRLNIRVKPVVTLARKRDVATGQLRDRLACISMEIGLGRDSISRTVLAIISLFVKGRSVALVVRW